MFEIKKVKNYRQFAELLGKETGCSILVRPMTKDGEHTHYQMNDRFGMSLGVLCVDDGYASFAPFETLESAENNQYININHLTQTEDFIKVMSVLGKIFVTDNNE